MKKEIERILDQHERAYRGDAWHGPSLRKILEDIGDAASAAKPLAAAHSIREIVAHIGAWQEEGVRRIEGRGGALDSAEDWPEAADWDAILERLDASHAAFARAVASLEDEALDEKVKGRRESFYVLLHGIIQHNLYHAGQIAILKKSMG
jgi:uncharacterized damage-inducible protein DinB